MHSSTPAVFLTRFVIGLLATVVLAGCQSSDNASSQTNINRHLQAVNFNDPLHPVPHDQPIVLSGARNEWVSFAVQIADLPASNRKTTQSLRLHAPKIENETATIALESFTAAQVLPMPVDVNRAGFVRHTALAASSQMLPRALLPVTMDKGVINVSSLRESAGPLLLWIDLHIPANTTPGQYLARCDLVSSSSSKPIASVPLRITVHDFEIPRHRHLLMVSRLDWEDLRRLYTDDFETVAPRLINRNDARYAQVVKTLDAIVKLAHQHRAQVVIPRLQPTVKWQLGRPRIDWEDVDSVLRPWLDGDAFADLVPLGFWPLPAVDFLDRFERESQLEYWAQAAAHFDQNNWLERSPVWIESYTTGRAGAAESIQLSADAAEILNVHPRIRVTVPLEEDQLQLAGPRNPNLINPRSTSRLFAAAPGIVFSPPIRAWPDQTPRPDRWLRTDLPGLVPYIGAGGDERDVRVWSWMAFLRNAGFILWGSPLPRADLPTQAQDPNDVVWFYPGHWFGVDEPVPTVQLKWLRRAQQDFEYLLLARNRGEVINASLMARLLTKPVEIQPGQAPDPIYALMSGTADHHAWDQAHRLLARLIQSRPPGHPSDPQRATELNLQMLRWCEPQEMPFLVARSAQWQLDHNSSAGAGQSLFLRLAIDLYNASDMPPDQNLLQWTALPRGWQVRPDPTPIPALSTYRVQRYAMDARYNMGAVDARDRQPAEVTFTHGFTRRATRMKVALPVGVSERHRPGLRIDGRLDDWSEADAIHNGFLVRMFSRPSLQKQELQYSNFPSTVFTSWADEHFYVAFRLEGVSTTEISASRNFVDYQFRRAWGEDLCQIVIQPLLADNTLGPVLHVVCKPTGHWVERKLDPRMYADPWQPFEGTGIRYSATIEDGVWRGEVAIPWKAIMDDRRGIPPFLRFNFSQHVHATGESASWAGPVDFGRDDSFTGILYLREPNDPGMAGAPAR